MLRHCNISFQELRERVLRGKYRIPFYMSTDCENLLKRFLVLNPVKRASLEVSVLHKAWTVLLSFRKISITDIGNTSKFI